MVTYENVSMTIISVISQFHENSSNKFHNLWDFCNNTNNQRTSKWYKASRFTMLWLFNLSSAKCTGWHPATTSVCYSTTSKNSNKSTPIHMSSLKPSTFTLYFLSCSLARSNDIEGDVHGLIRGGASCINRRKDATAASLWDDDPSVNKEHQIRQHSAPRKVLEELDNIQCRTVTDVPAACSLA